MTVNRLPARAAALLGPAMLLLAACGAEQEKTADAPAPSDAPSAEAPGTPPPSEAATPAPAATGAAAPAPKAGASGLAAYVDKYPFDKVGGVAWNDHPAVKAGIAAAVKDAEARKAIETLEGPAAPIEMRGGKLMSWACEAHNCGPHQWSVHVDPATGATDVCYFDEEASAAESRWFLAGGKEESRPGNCQ